MTYHRTLDVVMTPSGRAVFWGYWQPEMQLAKVRMEDGRFRSFAIADIKTAERAIVDAVKAAGFERVETAE